MRSELHLVIPMSMCSYLCILRMITVRIIWQDYVALLAYEKPETSPMFNLLTMDHRQSVADSLNCAVLGRPAPDVASCNVPQALNILTVNMLLSRSILVASAYSSINAVIFSPTFIIFRSCWGRREACHSYCWIDVSTLCSMFFTHYCVFIWPAAVGMWMCMWSLS